MKISNQVWIITIPEMIKFHFNKTFFKTLYLSIYNLNGLGGGPSLGTSQPYGVSALKFDALSWVTVR